MASPPPSSRVVIAGGRGFIGNALALHLQALGHDVVTLSRRDAEHRGPGRCVSWDARTPGSWARELDGAAAIVNLVGRSVDCVKTPDHCDEILRSRIEATRVLGEAMRRVERPPGVWVQMSTAHIYGDPPSVRCDESSPTGYGLAPSVGLAWEGAFRDALLPAQRGVVLRTSFVIGRDRGAGGGALARLRSLARWGLGGVVGTGTQGMSWIHELDMVRIIEQAITNAAMRGTYVATAPSPVSQREFMRTLRAALGVPLGLPAPAWLVRVGARWVLRTDAELALFGRYCVPTRLTAEGFEFRFPTLDLALRDLVASHAAHTLTPRVR